MDPAVVVAFFIAALSGMGGFAGWLVRDLVKQRDHLQDENDQLHKALESSHRVIDHLADEKDRKK